jgi:hypothetical protein
VLGVVALIHHEPWRDEAQAWLIARDLDLWGIFKQMSYEGHLPLWHMLLFPFAQTGSSYLFEFIIHLGLAIICVAVFLWQAPFSKLTKFLFVFSYYMAYEYSIIARNYNISILLLFLLAACHKRRFEHPLRYSLLIFLLFNTNVHNISIAGSLTILFGWEFLKNAAKNKKVLLAIFIMGLGFIGAFVQLLPSPDHMYYGFIFAPLALTSALKGAFFVDSLPQDVFAALGFVVFSLVLLSLAEKPAALFVALVSCLGSFCISMFKYTGSLRHHGLIFIFLFFSLWISQYYQQPDKAALPDKLDKIMSTLSHSNLYVFMINSCLFISCLFCAKAHILEYKYCFSGSKDLARFITENKLESHLIVAHTSARGSAVLPYLPGKKFWYADIREYGTYITWNKNYGNNRAINHEEVIARMKRAFQNRTNLLLLLSRPLDISEAEDFMLIYKTDCYVFRQDAEQYYLYEKIDR